MEQNEMFSMEIMSLVCREIKTAYTLLKDQIV